MKKFLSKSLALGLCATMLSFVPVYTTSAGGRAFAEVTVSKVIAGNAYIPADTEIEVEIVEAVSSKTAQKDDRVPMKLVSNLVINNVIVAPAGTRVTATVADVRKSGAFGRGGKLQLKINSFKTLNDVEIPLEYSRTSKGGKDSFALVAGLGGFIMKGKNINIDKGTRFTALVADDIDLNVPISKLSEVMKMPERVTVTVS